MKFVDAYHVVVTDRIQESRDFYVAWFGFTVAFEADWFVLLVNDAAKPFTLAFMARDHPSSPPSPAPHDGNGSFLTFQVDDARAEFARLVAAGVRCELRLTDEPWGQRRFGVIDPNGMWIDVVEQIEPTAGWWDPYVAST
jgi:catechol 2,3-dioxygenase-like lactoylglutathione lyase family enzyme